MKYRCFWSQEWCWGLQGWDFFRDYNEIANLAELSVVLTLQLSFTAPLMERFFDTRPVDFVYGVEIIALGVALFMILELEKLALRKYRGKHGGSRGSPGRCEARS